MQTNCHLMSVLLSGVCVSSWQRAVKQTKASMIVSMREREADIYGLKSKFLGGHHVLSV